MRLIRSFLLAFFIIGLFAGFAFMTERSQAEENNTAHPAVKEIVAKSIDPVKKAIDVQIAAIKSRDAKAAFESGTESLRNKHADAEAFLNNMRFEYRALYNAKKYEFINRTNNGNAVIQTIKVHARYGDPVTVIYRLEKQSNGALLIDSFAILNQTDAQPI